MFRDLKVLTLLRKSARRSLGEESPDNIEHRTPQKGGAER